MKVSILACSRSACLVVLCVGLVHAQTTRSQSISISANDLPPCTLSCAGSDILETSCTDRNCACDLDQALDHAASCLRQTCSYQDILLAKSISSPACGGTGYPRDRSGEYFTINAALGIVTAGVTIARLIFKRYFSVRRRYGPDDWLILSALLVGLPCAIVNRLGLVQNGLGKDAWTISTHQASQFAMYFYILEALYLSGISLVKLTLLVFYLTIFPSVSSGAWTRPMLWVLIASNIILAVVCVVVAIFQCNPVSYFWKQHVNPDMSGSCIASAPVAWVNASLNVALDVWMILIPLKEVAPLRMHWKKKAGVVLMFLMGTFVTVVSILRLASLSKFDASINITWDYYGVALWSTIEINVGIICTSLPTLRLILVRISPRIFGTKGSSTKSKHSSTSLELPSRRQRRLSSVETCVGDDEGLGPYARPKLFNVGSQNANLPGKVEDMIP